jgi:hypothetical protein
LTHSSRHHHHQARHRPLITVIALVFAKELYIDDNMQTRAISPET